MNIQGSFFLKLECEETGAIQVILLTVFPNKVDEYDCRPFSKD